ncbi:MAG: N4-gp56 family major capsid protein [Planctomycetota bacterium]|jgi:N4-gp56 family major capsid protein
MPTEKNVMTTSRIDHPIGVYFFNRFLRSAMPKEVHTQFGQGYAIPAGSGEVAKWRRYANPTAQTTPIGEVNEPAPVMMTKTDLQQQLRDYGAWIKPTTWLDMTGMSADKRERTIWLGKQRGITLDTLCRNVIAGGTSSTTATGGSATATDLNKTDLETIVTNLLGEDAEMIESPIKAGPNVGTSPIRDAFIVISHTDLRETWEAMSGFKHFTTYANYAGIYQGEWGSVGNMRIILTTNAYTSGSNYYVIVLAQNAFGNVRLPAADRQLIFHPAPRAGGALELFSTYGWKLPYACRLLNENYYHLLVCTKPA